MTYRTFFAASLIALLSASVASAQLQTININVSGPNGPAPNQTLDGTAAGATVAPATYVGMSWNDVNPAADPQGLVNSEGDATSIGLDWDPNGGNATAFTFSQTTDPGELAIFGSYFAQHAGFGPPVDPSQLTFTGLPAGSEWDLYFISQGDQVGQGGSFTIGATTLESAGSDPNATSFVSGENFVMFDNIEATLAGTIVVDFDHFSGGTDAFALLDGIQLVQETDGPPACDVDLLNGCNSTDFGIIRDNLFQFDGDATRGDGDLNGDGNVTFADYRLFKDDPARVVGGAGSLESANVPEPASMVLFAVGASVMVMAGRCQRQS